MRDKEATVAATERPRLPDLIRPTIRIRFWPRVAVQALAEVAAVAGIVVGMAIAGIVASVPGTACAQERGPRLVAVIVVPGFRADYFDRHRAAFSEGGLLRFLKQGAWYPEARCGLAIPEDAPALATLATGQWPARHGVIADQWWDRKTRARVEASDPGPGVPTLARMAARTGPPSPLVFAIAWRRATAALLVNLSEGNGCWFDPDETAFVVAGTPSPRIPPWLEGYHRSDPVSRFRGKPWGRLADLWHYADCAEDQRAGEGGDGFSAGFPHPLPGDLPALAAQLGETPLADRLVFEVAAATVLTRTWGKDDVADLLYVVPEALGAVGRRFGPRSHEALDTLIRLDRQVSLFLSALDLRVGPGRWTALLMGLNGMPLLAEEAARRGVVVHEPTWGVHRQTDPATGTKPTEQEEQKEKEEQEGRGDEPDRTAKSDRSEKPKKPGESATSPAEWARNPTWFEKVVRVGSQFYVLPAPPDAGAGAWPSVDAVATRLRELAGIHAVLTRSHFEENRLPEDPLGTALRRSYHPDASGDLMVVLEPGVQWPGTRGPHAPWPDSDRVTCLVLGWGVRRGVYHRPVNLAVVAPTLVRLLLLDPVSGAWERPLDEALVLPGSRREKRP